MYTRCFERMYFNHYLGVEIYEVFNLGEYGFEWYVNGELACSGLIEDIDEAIELLTSEGFNEVM